MINILKAKDRLGLTKMNKLGTEMKIIEVLPNDKIIVQFQDEFQHEKEIHWNNFKRGTVKNPYDRSIWGIGYLGEETETHFVNNKCIPSFGAWTNMIERCYAEHLRHKHLAYIGCLMDDEWHNYQNLRRWYDDNFYQVGTERMHIDKDILFKDNNLYSPYTCLIVPQRINMIFMKKPKTRDNDLPNAIWRCVNGYSAAYNGKSLGVFKTLKEAVYAHDYNQRIHILKVAEEYKDKIPEKVYNALINYNKEITID